MVIGLIIGLRITADQQRPEQTGGHRCKTIRTGENDNSREKMQNVRGDSSAEQQASRCECCRGCSEDCHSAQLWPLLAADCQGARRWSWDGVPRLSGAFQKPQPFEKPCFRVSGRGLVFGQLQLSKTAGLAFPNTSDFGIQSPLLCDLIVHLKLACSSPAVHCHPAKNAPECAA